MNFENTRTAEVLNAAIARGDKDLARAHLWLALSMHLRMTPPKDQENEHRERSQQMLDMLLNVCETKEFIEGPIELAADMLLGDLKDIIRAKRHPPL